MPPKEMTTKKEDLEEKEKDPEEMIPTEMTTKKEDLEEMKLTEIMTEDQEEKEKEKEKIE